MKNFITIILILFIANNSIAQGYSTIPIPNSSFEDWGSEGSYDDPSPDAVTANGFWDTANKINDLGLSFGPNATQSPDAYAGNSSIKLETYTAFGVLAAGTVYSGKFIPDLVNPLESAIFGQPFTETPDYFRVWYQYESVQGDSAEIYCYLGQGTSENNRIASAYTKIYNTTSGWTELLLPFEYTSSATPDTIIMVFASSAAGDLFQGQVGSTLYIDDINLIKCNDSTDECDCIPEYCISCEDEIQNGDETGIDCGGTYCEPCIGCPYDGNIFVDISATGANDGTSWTDAFTNLQDALAIGDNQAIHVAEGLYLPTNTGARGASFNMPNGVTILGGYPTSGGSRDSDTYTTTLSGEIDGIDGLAGNSYHVVKAQNVSCVTIDGITIKHGSATDANSFGRSRGGGIYAVGSELTISNSEVKWNKAIKGGGMFASLSPNITILSSKFSNNTADNGSALYHSNQTNMYIIKSRLINNNSLERSALEVNNSLYTRIENSVIASNPSKNSNAIALIATNRNQAIDVYNTTILGEAKDKNLITLQVGFGDQLDANFYNSIIAHLDYSFTKAFKDYNNGTLNLHTENCYIQGNSVIGTTMNNLYSITAGNLYLNLDYSVHACSPVVDAGNDAFAIGTVDIDGKNRFLDTVDIGAYEADFYCSTTARISKDSPTVINVFPNPTKDGLSIQTSEENISISIYDILGKKMTHSDFREIDISHYPSGIYILNIEQNGEVIHTEKVIKK